MTEKLLASINKIIPLEEYAPEDIIYSQKYNISPVAMVYLLNQLENDFNFRLTDDFIDALEMCTFARLEELLLEYSNNA